MLAPGRGDLRCRYPRPASRLDAVALSGSCTASWRSAPRGYVSDLDWPLEAILVAPFEAIRFIHAYDLPADWTVLLTALEALDGILLGVRCYRPIASKPTRDRSSSACPLG